MQLVSFNSVMNSCGELKKIKSNLLFLIIFSKLLVMDSLLYISLINLNLNKKISILNIILLFNFKYLHFFFLNNSTDSTR